MYEVGMACAMYDETTEDSGSWSTVSLFETPGMVDMNVPACSFFLSTLTPTTAISESLNFSASLFISGISFLQGGHQLAQKSRNTTLPLYSPSETAFPSRPFSVKSGAFLLTNPAEARAGKSTAIKRAAKVFFSMSCIHPFRRVIIPLGTLRPD